MANQGDHGYIQILTGSFEEFEKGVYVIERAMINERRKAIQHSLDGNDPDTKQRGLKGRQEIEFYTGVALSGGGIRSASVCLGAMQAINEAVGIEGVDYLSTVSGGGYIGCSLIATLQKTKGKFPFLDYQGLRDTDSVRHIRDFSNYLIPRGRKDIVTASSIFLRGILANFFVTTQVLCLIVFIVLVAYQAGIETNYRSLILDAISFGTLGYFRGLGLSVFWLTTLLIVAYVLILTFWIIIRSTFTELFIEDYDSKSSEIHGTITVIANMTLTGIIVAAFFELQPLILQEMHKLATSNGSSIWVSDGAIYALTVWLSELTPYLAPIAAGLALLSRLLDEIQFNATRSKRRWLLRIKIVMSRLALWSASIILPSFLWYIFLALTYAGMFHESYPSSMVSKLSMLLITVATNARNFLLHVFEADIRKTFVLAVCVGVILFYSWFKRPISTILVGLLAVFETTVLSNVIKIDNGSEAYLLISCALLLICSLIDTDTTSFFRFYRDSLSKAFLFDPTTRSKMEADLQQFNPNLHEINTNYCPYPIINTTINLTGSEFANKRGRNADFFIFTPQFIGSQASGYIGSQQIWKSDNTIDLATAMAISGAAVSANMGAGTIKLLTPTLALLNIRLGKWLRNPRSYHHTFDSGPIGKIFVRNAGTFLKEALGLVDEKGWYVYLTDGGHIENLGIFELLRRRCQYIIAIDAEADPLLRFPSLMTLVRFARTDLGVRINLPWQKIQAAALKVDEAFEQEVFSGLPVLKPAGLQCAACKIQYPDSEAGYLLYFKSSLYGNENDVICDYKRHHFDFPHELTADQFFGEQQLEAYRALGFGMVRSVLVDRGPFAVSPEPGENEEQTQERIRSAFLVALGGA